MDVVQQILHGVRALEGLALHFFRVLHAAIQKPTGRHPEEHAAKEVPNRARFFVFVHFVYLLKSMLILACPNFCILVVFTAGIYFLTILLEENSSDLQK